MELVEHPSLYLKGKRDKNLNSMLRGKKHIEKRFLFNTAIAYLGNRQK